MPIVSNVKIAISDLYRRYSPVISQSPVAVCVHLPSCPGHARVREGWGAGGFELRKRSQTKTKRNSSCRKMNCE